MNGSFWPQFLGVLLGAGLAFAGGLLIQWLVAFYRRRSVARMARNTLAVEARRLLEGVDTMDSLTQRTKAQLPSSTGVWTITTTPSPNLLRQFVSTDVLGALTTLEHAWIVVSLGNLENLNGRYGAWERTVTSPQAMAVQARHPESGTLTPHWLLVTDDLLWALATVRATLATLLMFLCKNASGPVIDREIDRIRTCLKPLRTRRNRYNFSLLGKSSDLRSAEPEPPREYLVVWKHDWPECPRKVIELSTGLQHDQSPPKP